MSYYLCTLGHLVEPEWGMPSGERCLAKMVDPVGLCGQVAIRLSPDEVSVFLIGGRDALVDYIDDAHPGGLFWRDRWRAVVQASIERRVYPEGSGF